MTLEEIKQTSPFAMGVENVDYAQYFDGTSYLNMLSLKQVVVGNVTFEPACRNNWHIHHKGGQILFVADGRGWYREWGKPARALKPGDVYGRVYGYPRAVRQHAGSENARLYLRALFVQH